MARYQKRVPEADLTSAKSWKGSFVRDTRLCVLGLVHDVIEDDEGVRLLARFPGESESRRIALEAVDGGEYLMPGDMKARYRPPSDEDRAVIAAAAR